jgi:large subunit ribosomal protein L10
MALTRLKKEEVLKKAKEIVSSAKSLVFVSFSGLTVTESFALRKEMRANDSGILVIKKTILKKALAEAGVKGELPNLPGEIAIGYGPDMIAPAKQVSIFGKKFENKLKIVGGVVDGEFADGEKMNTLANIPGLKELRGMFVNVINSPIQGLVVALDAIAKKHA